MSSSPIVQRWRSKRVGLAAVLATSGLLAACGDNKSDITQLTAAKPGTLATCETLTTAYSASGLVLTSATRVAAGTLTVAGQPIGAHCLVVGKLNERVSAVDGQTYAIRFELRMPQDWNGRFLYQANGGLDGNVNPAVGGFGGGPTDNALRKGFAVVSSDAGHTAAQNPMFGLDPQARLDFGYQTVAKLTPVAKGLVSTAYGRAADRSYFAGCSNGGRHALVATTRYPTDYDGILAGAPGWQLPKAAVANMFGAQRYASVASNPADISTGFTVAERRVVSAQVVPSAMRWTAWWTAWCWTAPPAKANSAWPLTYPPALARATAPA